MEAKKYLVALQKKTDEKLEIVENNLTSLPEHPTLLLRRR